MRAIILAGGLGTRLQSAVPDLPKPLAPIHQRPFLEYQMDYWIGKGVTEFYLSVCYLAQKIKDHFQESYRGCKISYIREPLPLGTGGAILYCLSKLPNKNEDVVILNGDTFVELDFDKMLGSHQKNASHLSVALREVEQNDRYSAVVLDKENKIIEFCQREHNCPTLLINAGVYLVKPTAVCSQRWRPLDKFSIEDDFFPEVIQTQNIYGFITKGRFIDIGVPNDYEKSKSFFRYARQDH